MRTTIMAVLAAVVVHGVRLNKNIMLADIESLSPEELMQRCHKKPTDCNGMYKIPISKLKAIVAKKEAMAAALAAKKLAKAKALAAKAKALAAAKLQADTVKSCKKMKLKDLKKAAVCTN